MLAQLLQDGARLHLPEQWPDALHPEMLAQFDLPTPFLICDLASVRRRYAEVLRSVPMASCFYAVKCNSSPEIVRALASAGSSFEVASMPELELLRSNGIDPAGVLYSNTVKPPTHVAAAYAAGLWRFAFDSEGELHKLARHAPGSAVYVRLRVDDSNAQFRLSYKFGADGHEARSLMLLARDLGLRPYGVTFHVGSQSATTTAWTRALAAAGKLMEQLAEDGVTLEMIDLGGGFPARYADPVPSAGQIGGVIHDGLDLLPYRPELVAVEPGRFLVAESAVMVTGIMGRALRAGEDWLYTDVGAYNGLMETAQTMTPWRYPLWTSLPDHHEPPHIPYTVTGPSCDSSDTTFYGEYLPAALRAGDRLYIGSTGAYTLSYASHFNGFPPPAAVFLHEQ